jgi:glutamate-1-semialdehyde 2,1-aminomutase
MLNMGLANVAASHGYDLNTSGLSAMPYYRLTNVSRRTHFAWIDECVKRGVYLLGYHNHFVSTTHTQEDLKRTFEIVDDAFTALGQASSER